MIPISLSQCEICHREFNNPKQLPCRHSFCKRCLTGQVIHTQSNCHLICHVCGTKVNLVEPSPDRTTPFNPVDFIQDDYFISSLIEFNRVNTKIGNTTATDVRCLRHKNETLKYYCDDCNIAVCKVCQTSDHVACHIELLSFRNFNSVFQSDLNSLTEEISTLDDKLFSFTESVRSKMVDLLRKKTESLIEISAYFSNLRTKMNEYLCKLEQQLRNEYADLLQTQTDKNREYLNFCETSAERCNSMKTLVKTLRNINFNSRDKTQKISLLQILREMKLTTDGGNYSVGGACAGWQRTPNLEFKVHPTEERKLFNANIANVGVACYRPVQCEFSDYFRETSAAVEEIDGSGLESRRGGSVYMPDATLTQEMHGQNNQCFNNDGLLTSLENGDRGIIPEFNSTGVNGGNETIDNFTLRNVDDREHTDTTATVDIAGNVLLPTAPPLNDLQYDDSQPPPYSPYIVGERYTPINPPVASTNEPPPPYPALPAVPSRPPSARCGNIPGAATHTESRRPHQVSVKLVNSFGVTNADDRMPSSFMRLMWVKSDQFLVMDRWNNKIRLFNENGNILSSAAFKGAQPWDIASLNERQYAVTFPKSSQICIICLSEKPDIVVTDWKYSRYSYICIAYFRRDNVFICGTAAPFSEPRIDVVKYNNTQSCSVIRSFKVDAYGSPIFQYPRSVKVTEEGTIIISDYTMNCVTFVSFNGFVIASYKGTETARPFEPLGICLDSVNKDVYVIESTRRAVQEAAPACIHRLTMDGEFLGIIPKDVGIDSPKELSALHMPDGKVKLAVTKRNGVVQIFSIQL